MRTIDDWFASYAESHQNKTNKRIHFICVPLIFWSVLALLWSIPVPGLFESYHLNWALLALMAVLAWDTFLSPALAIGMLLICYLLLPLNAQLEPLLQESFGLSLWAFALMVFVLAWIGQFIGHRIEGRKPSFFTDLAFLLIGPLWILHFVYKSWGIKQ